MSLLKGQFRLDHFFEDIFYQYLANIWFIVAIISIILSLITKTIRMPIKKHIKVHYDNKERFMFFSCLPIFLFILTIIFNKILSALSLDEFFIPLFVITLATATLDYIIDTIIILVKTLFSKDKQS